MSPSYTRFLIFIGLLPMFGATTCKAQGISFRAPINTVIPDAAATQIGVPYPADFNGDGIIDVGFITLPFGLGHGTTKNLNVAIGHGDGTFQPIQVLSLPSDAIVTTRKLVPDGITQWIYLLPQSSTPQLFTVEITPQGTFGTPQSANLNLELSEKEHESISIEAADLNGDGKTDLVLIDPVRIIALLATANNTFGSPAVTELGSNPYGGKQLLIADPNGDHIPDLTYAVDALNDHSTVVTYPGRGDGLFGPPINTDLPFIPVSMVNSDLTGDGVDDLIVTTGDSSLFPRSSPETSPQTQTALIVGSTTGAFKVSDTAIGSGFLFWQLADLDGDRTPDLIGDYGFARGNGEAAKPIEIDFLAPPITCQPPSPCYLPPPTKAVADMNGDGKPDLVFAYEAGDFFETSTTTISVFLNDSSSTTGLFVPGVASVSFSPLIGEQSLVTAFGSDLASTTAAAGSGAPPTTLGGVRLHMRGGDGTEALAPLYYVSPTQINYVLPPGIHGPFASISIEREGRPYQEEGIAIRLLRTGPSLFTLGNNGLAAAVAIRVNPDGTQSQLPVSLCSSATSCEAVPLDLTLGYVYLSLYGTGFSAWDTSKDKSQCDANGIEVPITYIGSQLQFMGLDQLNLLLPSILAGSGDIEITCNFDDGAASHQSTVHVTAR